MNLAGSGALGGWQPGTESHLPVVWIIVLNWNRREDTVQCISSLRQLDYPAYRILVVDNGSTDGSPELFRTLAGVDLVANERNLGFAAGNNVGIEYALERGADYVLLLNNDTTVSPSLVSTLVEVAEADRQIGIVGPIVYYADRTSEVWFAGMRFQFGLYVLRTGLHLRPPIAPVEEVDFVSGCGMLVRGTVWQRIGLLDPDYFMYYEDLDLCIRAKRAGFRIMCATQAHMWHALSASSGGPDSPQKQYYQVKSTFVFCRKQTRGLQRVLNLGLRLAHAGFVAVRHMLRGRLQPAAVRMYLKGIADAMEATVTEVTDAEAGEAGEEDPMRGASAQDGSVRRGGGSA
jgi:GT2 family glycosyltransferase